MAQPHITSPLQDTLGKRSNRFRRHGLTAAATGLAATAITDPASASIISDLGVSVSTGNFLLIDGLTAGRIDLVSASMGMAGLDLALVGPTGSGSTIQLSTFNTGGMGMTDFLSIFNGGDTVDASLAFNSPAYLVDNSVTNPSWTPGATGYAGFVFDTGSGPMYGWLQIQLDASATNFTILQWAYENTPNTPINVAAIPEPSTALLICLGLAGLAARVRRGHEAVDPPAIR